MKLISLRKIAEIAKERGLYFCSYSNVGHVDFGTFDPSNYSMIHITEAGGSPYATPLFDIRDKSGFGCTIDTHLGDHPGYVETTNPVLLKLLARPEMHGIAKWLGVQLEDAA